MAFEPFDFVASGVVGSAVFLLIWSLFRFPVEQDAPIHRRIAMAMGVGERQTVFEQPLLQPIMAMGLAIAQRMNTPGIRARIRRDLNASGNPNGYSVEEYAAICIVTSMTLGAITLVAELFTLSNMLFLALPLMVAVGFGIPLFALNDFATKRKTRIAKQLPYTLDLIGLTMAAGSTFNEAIDTIVRDNPDDDLNQELAMVQAEIGFGTTRSASLMNFADRVNIETLRSIIGAINQAEDLGTPLSDILKEQAGILRNARSVRAEKLAASASLRILIPSMLILLAAVLIVFGPFIVKFIVDRTFY